MPLKARLLRREVLPFLASFAALVLVALDFWRIRIRRRSTQCCRPISLLQSA